jgi:hypothetical protein
MIPRIKTVFVESKEEKMSSCREPVLISYKLIFHVQIGNVIVPVILEQPNFADLEKVICDKAVKILEEQVQSEIVTYNKRN